MSRPRPTTLPGDGSPRGGAYADDVHESRQAEVRLPGEPTSVPTARRFVREVLRGWSQEDVMDDAMLVVSELITNAVLHTQGEVTVGLRVLPDGSVQVEVLDTSVRLPRLRGYGTESTTGRGLRMIADVARSWGVEKRPGGKRVWATLQSGAETA